ncbi:MAG TPA: pectate lyase [Pyrinomonadaceae bacterium]|nr:pectate lyase [Pyrinomonadaceae bacterium]
MRAGFFSFLLVLLMSTTFARADVTVAADGTGDVRTVQAAIDKVPVNNKKRFVIRIKPGTYVEQVRVPADKPYISFIGESAERTKLTFNLANKAAGSTSASYSVYIGGHDFYAENVTLENSFGTGSQAVAVLVEADRAVFKNVRFLGWQDTLYAKNGRQYYQDCYIEGHVDYIFGQAAAVFENCTIHSKGDGYIAAPMRFAADEPSGFVFINSTLTSENTTKGVYLGRPWRDYGRTIFINTKMDAAIRPEGWHHWEPQREKTAYFAEYGSTGKGASNETRVAWARKLGDADIKQFSSEHFLQGRDGWDPKNSDDAWQEKTTPDWSLVAWSEVFKQKPLWYQTDEAARIADQLLIYQKENGGFEKNVDMALMLTQKEKDALIAKRSDVSETTIDNRTTYPQVAYLGRLITASLLKPSPPANLPKYKDAFNKGLDYLLASQYENGGFPQFYPLHQGYYSHITFNDDAMIGVLRVLRDIAKKKEDYLFVDEVRREKAERAVGKALPLILKLQVVAKGKKTIWAAQYDENTLKPAPARKFEPVSLTAGESVGIVRFLMQEKPTPEITDAIESAVAWYVENKINGVRWERVKGENTVVKDKTAPPIWARFYQIESMRPIFIGRDAVIKYDVAQIEAERRNGYAWYVSEPNRLVNEDYQKWKAKKGTDDKL